MFSLNASLLLWPYNQSLFTHSKHEKQIRQTQTFTLMSFKKYVGDGPREKELKVAL